MVTIHKIEIKGKGYLGYDTDGEIFRCLSYGHDAQDYPFYFTHIHHALDALGSFYEKGYFCKMNVEIITDTVEDPNPFHIVPGEPVRRARRAQLDVSEIV